MTKKIEIYASSSCRYCRAAVVLLDKKGVEYVKIEVDDDEDKRDEARERSGKSTIPQIFVDGESLGGFDDLEALDAVDKLDAKLGIA